AKASPLLAARKIFSREVTFKKRFIVNSNGENPKTSKKFLLLYSESGHNLKDCPPQRIKTMGSFDFI
ncbi:MAG: hypothetical protein ABH952_02460, partial [Candidatus Omnitrophota bacterium]